MVLDNHEQHLEDHIVSFFCDLLLDFFPVLFYRAVVFVDDPEGANTFVILSQCCDLLAHVLHGSSVVK